MGPRAAPRGDRPSPTARSYAPLATVVGVASRPMRPLRVVATARSASGRTTPITSMPSVVWRMRALQAGQRSRGGGVARDDQQLRPPAQQLLGDLRGEALDLLGRALAVGEPRGVPEIQEVLARQAHEQLVQDRQPAHARVEHGDRPCARIPAGDGAVHARHHFRALPSAAVRALVVSNMQPDRGHPQRGRFVRDQVDALRGIEGVDVELYEFAPGKRELARAAWDLRRRYGRERWDVVHAHFGLTAWPALAVRARVRALTVHGTDLSHPRTRRLTARVIPRMDILAAASTELAQRLPIGRRARAGAALRRRSRALSPDPARAGPRAAGARSPTTPFVLFLAEPSRKEKRYDQALELARDADVRSARARRRRARARRRCGSTPPTP